MTSYTYERSLVTSYYYDIDEYISSAVEVELPGRQFSVNCAGAIAIFIFSAELNPDDKSKLDLVITTYKNESSIRSLNNAKQLKYPIIDTKTDQLISLGFEYPANSGNMFELSLEAQLRMNALLVIASTPYVTYPIRWNFLDDSGYYDLQNATEAITFCMTAVGTYKAHIDSGTTIKSQIRSATTVAEVEAVIDPR